MEIKDGWNTIPNGPRESNYLNLGVRFHTVYFENGQPIGIAWLFSPGDIPAPRPPYSSHRDFLSKFEELHGPVEYLFETSHFSTEWDEEFK